MVDKLTHLKQLEADNLVIRKAKAVVPPHVTYSLSPSGMGLKYVLHAMASWAIEENKDSAKVFGRDLKDFPGMS